MVELFYLSIRIELFYFNDNFHCIALWVPAFTHTAISLYDENVDRAGLYPTVDVSTEKAMTANYVFQIFLLKCVQLYVYGITF